jgi:hypothetical protein
LFTLMRDGTARGRIRISPWAREHEVFAAQELSRYVGRITQADLPVTRGLMKILPGDVILADLSDAAIVRMLPRGLAQGLRYDGFRIRTHAGLLYIVSREAAGLVFGVYEYLRRCCGCSFLDYAPRGENVPTTPTIQHDAIDWTNNPACWYRAMQMSPRAEPPEVFARRLDWMAKNGYSHILVNYGNGPDTVIEGLFSANADTPWAKYRDWLIPALRKRGIGICLGHHNLNILVPPEQYLKQRPDFFALIDGKRQDTPQFSWCLSNPDLVDVVSQRLLALAENNPEADMLSLWPNDGSAPMCQCDSCRKLMRPEDDVQPKPGKQRSRWGRRGNVHKARYYLQFCNQVAQRFAAVHPRKRLSIIAYHDMNDPPRVDVTIHPNIVVHLAIYWRCSRHPLFDPKCALNRQFASIIDAWLKVMPDPASLVLTTYEQGMGCWKCLPFPVTQLLLQDWAHIKELGIGGFKTNASTTNHGVYQMNYAAQTRAVREVAPEYEPFVDEYCSAFYGPAAIPMAKLHRLWEKRMRDAGAPHVDPSPSEFLHTIFNPAVIRKSQRLCQQAMSLTSDPVLRWRIGRMATLTEYVHIGISGPRHVLYKKEYAQKLTAADLAKLVPYVAREAALVRASISLGDDLFGTQAYALRYLHDKRLLARISERDGKIQ